jgi:hypothetical protein
VLSPTAQKLLAKEGLVPVTQLSGD